MKIAFYKAKGDWLDKTIRLFTGQKYTHCEMIFPNGYSFSASGRDGGTRFKNIEYNPDNWDILDYHIGRYEVERIYNLSKIECCKKYDFIGILLSIIFNYNIHNKDKWFCSEICGYLLGLEKTNTLTPGDLYDKLTKK